MSSRKKIRQAPGRLLRQKLINLRQVCRKSGNPAFKGPETLDMALDSLRRKITHTDIYAKATRRFIYPARHNRPSNQLNTIKYNINKKDDYVLYERCTTRRALTTKMQVQH
jgi:hypothetical protein